MLLGIDFNFHILFPIMNQKPLC